jgi:lipopolysaccharide/colanic/teichoic acid biosynthesis glycosyltransferase
MIILHFSTGNGAKVGLRIKNVSRSRNESMRTQISSSHEQALNRVQCLQKTVLDKCIAALLLLSTLPVFLAVALIVKLESSGPIFFKQPRLGFNNNVFIIYKFRTMYCDGDSRSLDGSLQASRSDPRITTLGKWLRKYSVDELPQLINVIKGDMSLVGPRPHPLNVQVGGQPFQDIVPDYAARHRILPGMTGWAQVNGWRGETIVEEQIKQRVAHDLFYIENWSMTFDIHILFLTLVSGIFSESAF